MSVTSIENVLDFVCDLNALVRVHQYPVDQQLGQLGGQCVRIKIALDASFRLSCRACSSCFCFACANTAA